MDRKIKVLRIINRFNLGGPTYNATYLTAYLSDQFETKLIGGAHEEHEGASTFIPEKHKVDFEIVEEMQREISLLKDLRAFKKIRKIIREYKPDIVHTHASKAGFLGRLAADKEGVPVIVHTFHGHVFHSYFSKLKTAFYKFLERYVAKRSKAIIAISEIQKKELSDIHKIAPKEKIRIIPLGFDLDRFQENKNKRRRAFREKYNIQDDTVCIGIIGRLTSIKNHDLFLDSIDKVLKKHQNIKAFIIGDGELMEKLKSKADNIEKKRGVNAFVFTSWIKNIEEILPAFEMICLSSLNEGTPVSLIEAQAASVPVISTNVGGVTNVVEDGKSGIIVNDFETETYANSIISLIENKEIRDKLSQNGWNHVREKYHYKRLCSDMEKLYKELLTKQQ